MNYLQDKKTKNKYTRYIYIAVIVLVLFYFRVGLFNKFSFITNFVLHPVVFVGDKVGGGFMRVGAYFSSKMALTNDNESLRNQLTDTNTKMANYDAVLAENVSLKEILGRKVDKLNLVLSAILTKPSQSPYDTLVIDGAFGQGIKVGDMVFAYGNIPIGRVAEVDSNSSKVVLFTNPGEKTQVVVENSTNISDTSKNIFMEIVGRGGGNFEMIVPNDFTVKEGSEVALPGITPYVVGVMEKVISDPRDAFQKVLLVSPVNIQEIKFVQVEI